MTQEEKSLLLKDLSARLSYGTIVSVTDGTIKYKAHIESVSYNYIQVSPVSDSFFTPYTFYKISEIKPYLQPMSSMTEEEEKEFNKVVYDSMNINNISASAYVADWLYSKHLDVHGLIPKGLALEAPEGMYKKGE